MLNTKQTNEQNKLTKVSLSEFLNSLEYYANKDFCGDYMNLEFNHITGESGAILDLFWGEGDENDFHLELKVSYTAINDEYGLTQDIDGMEVIKIEQGDGYSNTEVLVEGANENNLAPLITIFFDKYAERGVGKYDNYCINLFSERGNYYA